MTRTIEEARDDAASPTGPLLLVIDHPGHRAEAHITDLGLTDHGFRAHPLLCEPLPEEVTGRRYAEKLAAGQPPEPGAAGILAYCAASALAVHYAGLVVEDGRPAPPLVLFDAEPARPQDIVGAYLAACDQIGARHDSSGPFVDVEALVDRPEELLAEVRNDLTRRARNALRAEGLSHRAVAGPVAHFTDQHVTWIAHLLAAHSPIPGETDSRMLHVVSRHHPDQGDWLPDGELRTVRVDCDRSQLLTRTETRDAVLEFLRPPSRAPRAAVVEKDAVAAAGSPLREHVEEIWRAVLQTEISEDTDFFDFGGHSFVALRIIAMLDDRHGIRPPVRVLFENPRFGDFVTALGSQPTGGGR